MSGKTSPIPPPGLREAVGPVAEWAEATLSHRDREREAPVPNDRVVFETSAGRLTIGHLRAFVAAYDATGGEHGPVVPDDVRTELAGYLYEAQGLTGYVRELLAPGDRGRLRLMTLRKLASILDVKPGVSR